MYTICLEQGGTGFEAASEAAVSGKGRVRQEEVRMDGKPNREEKDKSKKEKRAEEKAESFENMTHSELIALVQLAPALRHPADVARGANWFRRKADTLRKLESSNS